MNLTYLKDEQSKTTTETNCGTKEISPSENTNLPKETSGRKGKKTNKTWRKWFWRKRQIMVIYSLWKRNGTTSESKIQKKSKNEAVPETNTPIDGNIQSGASVVRGRGTAKQESSIQENLPNNIDDVEKY